MKAPGGNGGIFWPGGCGKRCWPAGAKVGGGTEKLLGGVGGTIILIQSVENYITAQFSTHL